VPTAQPTPLCGNGDLDAGEECDDGNRLDGDCCSATCEIGHHPNCLDHFLCYKAKTTSNTPKFTAVPGVGLVDQFGSSAVEVKKPERLCAPTNKLDEDPTAPSHPDHLNGYKIKRAGAFTAVTAQTVVDQFGTLVLDLKKPVGVLVPSAKSLVGMPPSPATSPDHFQCYKVKVTANTPKFVAVPGVSVQDQFGSMQVEVKKPKRLCAPVDKNGETPGAETHANHLMCYLVKQTSQPKFPGVGSAFVHDQFGPATRDAKKPAELCVPAFKNPVCGNGVIEPDEDCDGDDCCTATCTFAPAGTPCTADADPCTNDVCSAGGSCGVNTCTYSFSGVQTNLPIATLSGWNLCYTDTYANSGTSLASILATCDEARLLMGCRTTGSPTLLVAANAPRADVTFDTGTSNTPHDANGVGWYFNSSYSWGFALQGDPIDRYSCDVMASSFQGGPNPAQRLCWHTNGGGIDSGWRCGANDSLNFDPGFERLIFEAP
jgi:cysteine-rich repeat protein